MQSIRSRLSFWLVLTVAALGAVSSWLCYARARAVLSAEFDRTLEARARALSSLVQRETDGKLEIAPAELTMPEFGATFRAAYMQMWDAEGRVLMRSASLAGHDIIPPAGHSTFWNLSLPDGRRGRAVQISFVPISEEDQLDAPTPGKPTVRSSPASVPQSETSKRSPQASVRPVTLVLMQDIASIEHVEQVLFGALVLMALVLCGGVLLVVPMVVKRGLHPIRAMARQAQQIDAASLSIRFPMSGIPKELFPISQRLNDLLGRLETAFDRERRFTANVAHELRTPLAGLRSLAEVALKWPPGPAGFLRNTQDTLAIARHMEGIVVTLLAIARCEIDELPITREATDVVACVHRIWPAFEYLATSKQLDVRLPPAESCPPIDTDPSLLASIITNLLSNAAAHASAIGLIDISVVAHQGTLTLKVLNSCQELTEADLPRLFEPFWRRDPSRTGTDHCGLGLSLVGTFVNRLNGTVEARLAEDHLFEILVTLPAQPSADSAPVGHLAIMADA